MNNRNRGQDDTGRREFTGGLQVLGLLLVIAITGVVMCGVCATSTAPPQANPVNVPRAAPTAKPTKINPVTACLEVWEFIDYVAEGYEIDGLSPDTALDTAIIMVSETYDVPMKYLDECVVILQKAGY